MHIGWSLSVRIDKGRLPQRSIASLETQRVATAAESRLRFVFEVYVLGPPPVSGVPKKELLRDGGCPGIVVALSFGCGEAAKKFQAKVEGKSPFFVLDVDWDTFVAVCVSGLSLRSELLLQEHDEWWISST